MKRIFAAALLCTALAAPAIAQTAAPAPVTSAAPATDWTVKPEWISAHVRFLAGPELQGRGSATRDEAIAAAYVAARFQGYGLQPAPGTDSYVQKVKVIRPRLDGEPAVTVAGRSEEHTSELQSRA